MPHTTPTAKLGLHDVRRIGFGAMQLAGPGVFGPPRDRDAALAVLRRAVELGVDHIDTSQYYGPNVVNELIREALHPYPDGLRLVTKVGARRDDQGAWLPALRPDELRAGVEDNLRTLGIEQLTLVNLRLLDDEPGSGAVPPLAEMLGALDDLRREGKLELIGLSNVTRAVLDEGARSRPRRRRAEPVLDPRPLERGPARGVPRARAGLRALLPAGQRLHGRPEAARAGRRDRARGGQARRHPFAGGPGLAAASRRAHPAHPGDVIGDPPRGEPRAADLALDAGDMAALEEVQPAGDPMEAVHN
jgi:hypothetical protein